MKPAPFDYAAPTLVPDAVSLLSDNEEAKALAGGQSLVPLLSLRLARPALLVDLNRIDGLSSIESGASSVRFGALVRQRQLETQPHHPMMAAAARWIAHAAVRSRGTIGGSLAHADPAAELPVVATALGAVVEATGPSGVRTIDADRFFHGLLQTDLAEDELLTSVDCPLPDRWGFAELARRHGDFALVLVAVAEVEQRWRVVVGGVEGIPRRITEAERLLDLGDPADPATAVAAASAAADSIDAADHLHASAGYQRGMTAELTRRAVDEAVRR